MHIYEIEIEETVKRVVKCEEGYRIATQADRNNKKPKGTKCLDETDKTWVLGEKGEWAPGYHYQVPIEPEIFTHNGKRYEVVTDPEAMPEEGWIYRGVNQDTWEKGGSHVVWPVGRYKTIIHARPLDSMYEGEVVAVCGCGLLCRGVKVDLPSEFKLGQRVRVEVVG